MAHTPRPWVHEDDGFIYGEGAKVADPHCAQQDIAEREANARLIAAAPDLLEALRQCVSEDGALCWRNHAFAKKRLTHINEIVRAVLAKAEG